LQNQIKIFQTATREHFEILHKWPIGYLELGKRARLQSVK
jgi:hypothetical protein